MGDAAPPGMRSKMPQPYPATAYAHLLSNNEPNIFDTRQCPDSRCIGSGCYTAQVEAQGLGMDILN